jgi:choice-of-anchor A domain-containing protein
MSCGEEPAEPLPEPAPAKTGTTRQEVRSTDKVLILGTSVNGGINSPEAQAVRDLWPLTRPAVTIDVKDAAQWAAMTREQFMSYQAIIIGDASCTSGTAAFQAAIDNKDTWAQVIDGDVVILGTNPSSGSKPQLMRNGIEHVIQNSEQFRTGLYISLGCAYQNASAGTPVPLLSWLGEFKVAGSTSSCAATAGHMFKTRPAYTSHFVDDASLGTDGCAARSVFTTYPFKNFAVAAIGLDAPGTQEYIDFLEDEPEQISYFGTPYILVRGAVSLGNGCGISDYVPPGEECDNGDGLNGAPGGDGIPAAETCSFSCRLNWCGDGRVDELFGEECDNGRNNGRTHDANGTFINGMCSSSCKIVPPSPPVARCTNVTVSAPANACGAPANINNGSSDPDGDLVGCTQSPAGPYNMGSTAVTLTCTDSQSQTASCTGAVTVGDVTPPAVTAGTPNRTLQCNRGVSYTDLSDITASDLCSPPVTMARTGSVSMETPGTYVLTYSARDTAGNTGSATRTVNVVDTLAPSITLNGPANGTHECGSPYTDPGATANDACAGDLSPTLITSGPVNVFVPGNYTRNYSVTDPSGNDTTTSRAVTVHDTLVPQIQVLPGPSMIECNGSPYVDPGATASDLCTGALTQRLSVSSNLDQSRSGQYTVTYRVADAAGNEGIAVRQLTVGRCPICINLRLNDYNLFLLEDYNGGHDVVGKVAAGGNITMEDFSVGHGQPDNGISNTLVAGGNLTLNRGRVWGDAWYGGAYSTNPSVTHPRGSAARGTPIHFAARFAELRSQSSQLASLPVNGTTTREVWGGVMMNGTSTHVNVFEVNASAFNGAVLWSIDAPAGSFAVVNIRGASANFGGLGIHFSGGIDQHGVLFNFVDATRITAQGFGFWGTVLAPYAHVNLTNGSFDGGIYAKSFTGNAEGHINPLHNRDFCL